jgi:hypothetical protein
VSWVSLKPGERTLARAREARARAGSVLPPTARFDSGHDWVGPLGELAVCKWLGENGVEYEHHGGLDDKPDIELPDPTRAYGLAVKTQLVLVDFHPAYGVVVPAGQRPAGDVFCFCAYQEHDNRLLILGFMGVARFYATSFMKERGMLLGPRTRASFPCHQLEARRLMDPEQWLTREVKREATWS